MNKRSWKEHYWYTVPCMRTRILEICNRVGEGCHVLEVGCNEGFLSKALMEEKYCHVTSVDKSQEMVVKAEREFGIKVIKADVNALPFEDESFDVVVAGELLEHLPNPFKGLSELFRVARERVIISLPIGSYWLGEFSHIWELGCSIISHDDASMSKPHKHILVIEFMKRRAELCQ